MSHDADERLDYLAERLDLGELTQGELNELSELCKDERRAREFAEIRADRREWRAASGRTPDAAAFVEAVVARSAEGRESDSRAFIDKVVSRSRTEQLDPVKRASVRASRRSRRKTARLQAQRSMSGYWMLAAASVAIAVIGIWLMNNSSTTNPIAKNGKDQPEPKKEVVDTPKLELTGPALASILDVERNAWSGEKPASIVRGSVETELAAGMALQAGDRINSRNSTLKLQYAGEESFIEVQVASTLDLSIEDGAKRIALANGVIDVTAAPQPADKPMRLNTKRAEALVVGTQFTLSETEGRDTRLVVYEGKVRFTRSKDKAAVDVAGGEFAVASDHAEFAVHSLYPKRPDNPDVVAVENMQTPVAAPAPVKAKDKTVKVKGKPNVDAPYIEQNLRTLAGIDGFKPVAVARNEFGGRADKNLKATGFFRVENTDGRWYMVDPAGAPYLSVGVCSVAPGKSVLPKSALQRKFGSDANWAANTVPWLADLGFNAIGAWSLNEPLRNVQKPMPYCRTWDFMAKYGKQRGGTFSAPGHTGYPNDCIFVFDPEFEVFCDQFAQQLAAGKNDKYLIGHFTDNELPFRKDLLDRYLQMPPADHGFKAARAWLTKRKGANVDVLDDVDREAFLGFVVDRYMSLVSAAVRKYDPNHLILGPRFYGETLASEAAFRAAGPYVDALAVNIYWGMHPPSNERLRRWSGWLGKPLLATEFYTKGEDSDLPNRSGAGWIVPTQHDRGIFYQNITLGFLESRVFVGWHWFMYQDNDPNATGKDASNRDSNKGMVDIHFTEYAPLTGMMREINTQVYGLADFFDGRAVERKP